LKVHAQTWDYLANSEAPILSLSFVIKSLLHANQHIECWLYIPQVEGTSTLKVLNSKKVNFFHGTPKKKGTKFSILPAYDVCSLYTYT